MADGAPAADRAATAGGFDIDLARHQAGRIDRELRNNKSGVPFDADTPMAAFRRNAAAARADRSMTLHEDITTTPDGIIIYRYRQGKGERCRRSGSVGLGIAGAAGINDAGWISCPKAGSWQSVD